MQFSFARMLRCFVAMCLGFCWLNAICQAEDWPTWRHDVHRSSVTSEQLPDQLHLQWMRELPTLTPAWPEDPRIQFDAS